MRKIIEEWQELSISKRKYKFDRMHKGVGIAEEDKDSDRYSFRLVSYTPAINKFGDIDDEAHRANNEQYMIFKADLR